MFRATSPLSPCSTHATQLTLSLSVLTRGARVTRCKRGARVRSEVQGSTFNTLFRFQRSLLPALRSASLILVLLSIVSFPGLKASRKIMLDLFYERACPF